MFKKKCMIILALLLCGSLLATAYPIADASQIEEDDAIFVGIDAITPKELTASSETDGCSTAHKLNGGNFDDYHAFVSDTAREYYQQLRSTPENILSGSTETLLEYFLKSDYMLHQLYSEGLLSSPDIVQFEDYTSHSAFKELISRKDFPDTLEKYAKDLLTDSKFTETDMKLFKKLFGQTAVNMLVSNTDQTVSSWPNLVSIYEQTQVSTTAIGDYLGTINDIDYYCAGTVNTANNLSVVVGTPERELTNAEVNYFNSLNYTGATRLYEPTAVYNCHSYAWYRYSTSNPYWIFDIAPFLNDNSCTSVNEDSIQVNDIIVYYDIYGRPLHSGVVSSTDSSGSIVVQSKRGQGGVYLHAITDVPIEYFANPSSGLILCRVFTYHDYESVFTGNHYHTGRSHHLEYVDRCAVCRDSGETTWKFILCSGPPCLLPAPASVDHELT